MIVIKWEDYRKIVDWAREGLPNEACGLLGGTVDEDGEIRRVEAVYPLTNVDASREHFSMDPREQLAAVKAMRSRSQVPVGNFHSHPETPSRPSEEDKRLARDPRDRYLILSLMEAEPVLKAFIITKEKNVEQDPILIEG